jgi:hypothetical protein
MTEESAGTPAPEAGSTRRLLPALYAELRRLAASLTAPPWPAAPITGARGKPCENATGAWSVRPTFPARSCS